MFELTEPHKPRPIRFLELWEANGWRMKIYGIAYNRDLPRHELIATAKVLAGGCLPQPAMAANRYGVGFIGVHDGRGANFIFIDWWADENELHHHVYISSAAETRQLRRATAGDPQACVWDLSVLNFERQAWLETVLTNPTGADIEAYLLQRMNAVT